MRTVFALSPHLIGNTNMCYLIYRQSMATKDSDAYNGKG